MMTSPTRPIACESDDIIEMAPMSCRMSSAAMVSRRMRDSANATSSAIAGSRWWHTISMSRCSSSVLTVNGRVGLVDDGSTLDWPTAAMMSGAWPPPAPSVWKVWMVRSLNAASVVSRKPPSLSVSEWIATWTSMRSATARQLSIAAGVLPQSSCSFRPMAPARTCSSSGSGRLTLPLPRKPRFIGKASAAPSIECRCHGPGVQVVAAVPTAGPVPPPIMVVTPLIRASSICCGQMKWMWVSTPPAVTIMPSPAMISVAPPIAIVTCGWMSGIAGLADRRHQAVLQADVGLDDAPVVDDDGVGDDGVHHVGVAALRLAHAVADHFAAAELDLFAVGGEVLFDLDEQFGVGQPDAVAGGGAVHFGVGLAA